MFFIQYIVRIVDAFILIIQMQKQLKTIGWIGTGVMGKSMCEHLMKNGYALNIFTRTKAKAD